GWAMVDGEVRPGEFEVEQVLPAGQVQGPGLGALAAAAFEDVDDVVAAEAAHLQGVVEGAAHFVEVVDVEERNDFSDVLAVVWPVLLERLEVGMGVRAEGEEAPEVLLVAGFFALVEQRTDVLGILEVPAPVVGAAVGSDEVS